MGPRVGVVGGSCHYPKAAEVRAWSGVKALSIVVSLERLIAPDQIRPFSKVWKKAGFFWSLGFCQKAIPTLGRGTKPRHASRGFGVVDSVSRRLCGRLPFVSVNRAIDLGIEMPGK